MCPRIRDRISSSWSDGVTAVDDEERTPEEDGAGKNTKRKMQRWNVARNEK